MEFVTTGRVVDGRLDLRNRARMVAALKGWRDCEVVVTIERAHANRSQRANRYYWGVVVELIAEHTGYTPNETHEALKQLFLPKNLAVAKQNGEIVGEFVIGGSTAQLNKLEFGDYVAQIKQWALEKLDVAIPEPDADLAT